MCANREFGILDRDRDVKDGLKGLSDIQALSVAANKDRHRLWALGVPRCFGRRDVCSLGRGSVCARSHHGVAFRLQLGLGGG
jgi:hypothetical protein